MATVACDIGDLVRLSAEFRTLLGVLTNPTALTLSVRDPSGAVTTPTPVNDSAGAYHYDWTATLAGVLVYRYAGTGAVVAAEEAKVFVRSSAFP